jgi:hypothetical protein
MDSLGYRLGDGSDMTRRVLGVSLSCPQKSEKLKFRDSAPRATCSRLGRSGAVWARMGVGMPEVKRLEKLRIWLPGVASRAGVQHVAGEIAGAERVGRLVNRSSESGHSEINDERPSCAQNRHLELKDDNLLLSDISYSTDTIQSALKICGVRPVSKIFSIGIICIDF